MSAQFDGSEGSPVPLSEASDSTQAFQSANPNAIKAHYIGKDIINDIFDQTGCVGIRVYEGIKDGEREIYIVGVDANGDDQLGSNHIVADHVKPCPDFCGKSNPLNSNR